MSRLSGDINFLERLFLVIRVSGYAMICYNYIRYAEDHFIVATTCTLVLSVSDKENLNLGQKGLLTDKLNLFILCLLEMFLRPANRLVEAMDPRSMIHLRRFLDLNIVYHANKTSF